MNGLQELVNTLTQQHGTRQESLLPILEGIQHQQRYISDDAMVEVARALDISAAQVYGTATFYSFLVTRPQGRNVIRVCRTITCMMHGKNQIIKELETILKIKLGETTPDRQFTLLETDCLGQCHQGPAMLINDTPYTQLTPAKVREIMTGNMT
jgi:NADH-quinone oxidoreductase E subunit